MAQRFIPPIIQTNIPNPIAQGNSNTVDRAMFDHLIEQISKLSSTVQELKNQSSWRHPAPMFPPLPPAPMEQYPPYPPYPPPRNFNEQQYSGPVQNPVDVSAANQEISRQEITKIPVIQETMLNADNVNALQLMSKYQKMDENLTLIIVWLQYFLVVKCKQKLHLNWSDKKDYTRAELLLALISNSSVLGEEFEKIILPVWIMHLREHTNAYLKIFSILIRALFSQNKINNDARHYSELLVAYLNAPRNVIFTKKIPNKSTTINIPVEKDTKKESYRIKVTLKVALDKILIQFLETALNIQMLSDESALDNLQQDLKILFERSDYSDKCSYLVNIAQAALLERQKLAEAKKAKKLTEAVNKN